MSVTSVLGLAERAGVQIQIDGDDLLLSASSEPPKVILHLISSHKLDIVALLRLCKLGWSPEDWQAYFTERAAIAQHDGKLPRQLADAQAFACCIVKWLELNLEPAPPGRCVKCGAASLPGNPLLPYGVGKFSQACLHDRCWAAWHIACRSQAIEAMRLMGIQSEGDPQLQQDMLRTIELPFLPWIDASHWGPTESYSQKGTTE
jgi:hypothetical protein